MIALTILCVLLALAAATGWAMYYRSEDLRKIERTYAVYGANEETDPVRVEDTGATEDDRMRKHVRSVELATIEAQLRREAEKDNRDFSDDDIREEAERIYEQQFGGRRPF